MNKKRNKIIRIGAIAVFVVMFFVLVAVMSIKDENESAQFSQGENSDIMEFNPFIENEARLDNSLLEYGKVLNKYAKDDIPDYTGDPIVMQGMSYASVDGAEVRPFTEGYSHEETGCVIEADPTAVFIEDKVTLIYEFKVSETALYGLNLEYFMPEDKANNVLVSFSINEKRPFFEASNVQLTRLYEQYKVGTLDDMGNEIKAKQREIFAWQKYDVGSTEGFYRNPYKFLLQASDKVQTLEITFSVQDVAIRSLSFVAPKNIPSYEEYREMNQEAKYQGETLPRVEIEEAITVKNDVKMTMDWDENYCSSPASYEEINYNIFGGEGWSAGNQSITFKTCEIKQAGWYQIAFRYQSPISDVVAYREIKIDGDVPFKEMEEYCFPASDSWICEPLKDEKQTPYLFYLTEGVHEITMTVKLGPMRHDIQSLEDACDYIDSLVKKVVQVTGSSRNEDGTYNVDTNRDWDLQLYIPTVKEDVKTCYEVLMAAYDDISKLNGDKIPYYLTTVKVTAELFGKLAEDTEGIPASLNDIVTNVASITDNIVNMKKQGLTLDYMVFDQSGKTYEDAVSSFWQNMYVAAIRFGRSFTTDYASIGVVAVEGQEDYPEIDVYASFGREQFEMVRSLVTEDFTVNNNIKVNLTMVAGTEGLIMLRYVAGTAPDASITFGGGSVVEYAMRGALYPLDTIDGFEKHLNKETSNFAPASFVPGLYQGHYYGMPETMSWNGMFYRTDIMEELGIDVTTLQTWDDIYDILPVLQENEMEFASNYSVGGYWPFMYQHGAEMYDPNGKVSALNSQAAYDAYLEYTNLYIKYKMPMNVNFYQRFRNGDVPIGIANVGLYCQLKVAAPEIIGKWDFVPLPGHYDEETGEIVRYAGAQGAMCVIVDNYKGEDKKNEARFENPPEEVVNSFKFLEWWTGAEAQAAYAEEVEIAYGVASRWTSSNMAALETQPYTDEEIDSILEQWRWVKESPNVPGGYYTERWLITALNKTVLQGENPRANLEDAIKEINKELKRKQEEFGIDEDESVVGREWLDDYPAIFDNMLE